ncbi:hypothetical protein B0J14DRAFT_309510 [Halenospora varia]|nr:hypothetical protein B0J14DRAFT_309510 [Halenospora varia]
MKLINMPDNISSSGYKFYSFESTHHAVQLSWQISSCFAPRASSSLKITRVNNNALEKISITVSTGSKEIFSLASHWLQDCVLHHDRSCSSSRNKFLPSRLIDTGPSSDIQARLCYSRELLPRARYFTLSHRWGQAEILSLRASNLPSLLEGIDLETLRRHSRTLS